VEIAVRHPLGNDVDDLFVLVSRRSAHALANPDEVDDIGMAHLPATTMNFESIMNKKMTVRVLKGKNNEKEKLRAWVAHALEDGDLPRDVLLHHLLLFALEHALLDRHTRALRTIFTVTTAMNGR
jgi:hypothetical protein